jgi:hypothetical protein
MKHVIIPTDFSIASLQTVHDVMRYFDGRRVKITLLHLVYLPDSIPHLPFRRHTRQSANDIPTEFKQACEIIANKYDGDLVALRPVIQCGETRAYMENLFDGLKADMVFIPSEHAWLSPFPDSVDAMALCRKCSFPIVESPVPSRIDVKRFSTIGDLLLVPNE